MNYRQHFFIGSSYMGHTDRHYFTFHKKLTSEGQPFDVHSQAWFCSGCGEVWARILVDNTITGESCPYRIVLHGCKQHPEPLHRTPPGSIRSWFKELETYLSPEMVRYEFDLLMKFLDERESNDQ